MEVFVARQPIFNQLEETVAYELLYRHNEENKFSPMVDGDEATIDVIVNSFINIGIETLSYSKPCFINFTENLLKNDVPSYFLPQNIVVEVLESVSLTEEIIKYIQTLNERGFKVALDDFVLDSKDYKSILPFVDILKVDFLHTSKEMRTAIERTAKKYNISLLAEKVETREDYEEAKRLGYTYFQGYFFCKPTVISSHEVPSYLHSYIKIIELLSVEEPNIDVLTEYIKQDISLSHKLLKIANTRTLRPRQKIKSIRQAIMFIGFKELMKWVYILAIRENKPWGAKQNEELIKLCLVRGQMCELITQKYEKHHLRLSSFMTGMLSLMDTLLGLPMERILLDLPLDDEICAALKGKENELSLLLSITIAMERADWSTVSRLANVLQINEDCLPILFRQAYAWAEEVFMTTKPYASSM
ncbi:EAL and HDOD domain-containing protein [Bacillus kexueae]|uniref:EAL and HDOD domain-containing protein n=1 Tax=Aeribacillus kexueae TaxID=2078952 RepID=UPI001FAF8B7B